VTVGRLPEEVLVALASRVGEATAREAPRATETAANEAFIVQIRELEDIKLRGEKESSKTKRRNSR